MGNFLVIHSAKEVKEEAAGLFRSGLEFARNIKSQVPSRIVEIEGVHAASFPRRNGSGTPIVTDPETGSWLLAIGTWLHTEGYGAGSEIRLLNRYLASGSIQLTKELEGFFVIGIGDAAKRETIIITDIIGSCHCFIRVFKNGIALSGSSLLLASLQDCTLDPIGCQEFLYTGVIYEDRTIYREVRKLDPASVYTFADGSLKAHERYWKITHIAPDSLKGEHAVKGLWETLTRAAEKIGRLYARPVCDLTGGYDSRVLDTAFLAAGIQCSTTVSGPGESPDVSVSKRVAQVFGLPHLHVMAQGQGSFDQMKKALPFTDGEYDLVEYARILNIHERLSQRFDISINGSFGEVARGYWWELLFPRIGACRKLDAERVARKRYAAQSYDASLFPPKTKIDLISHLTHVIENVTGGLSELPNTLQMDYVYLTLRMQRWQGRIASSTNGLWPCLSPFMFRSVLETMLRTEARLRQRSLLVRKMLTEFAPQIARIPLEHGYPAEPVAWNTFHRFWPLPVYYGKKILSKVIRTAYRNRVPADTGGDQLPVRLHLWNTEEVRDLLEPATMRLGSLIDPSATAKFLSRSHDQHFSYDGQWTRVLTLEYTLRVLEHARTERMHQDQVNL